MLAHTARSAALALALVLSLAMPAAVSASHHFETDLSMKYPAFDLTDLFVFQAATAGKTVFMIDVNPTTGKDGKAGFGENGLYNIHIATDRSLSAGMTLTFRFSNDGVVIGMVDSPNAPLGAQGVQIGVAKTGSTANLADGMRIWTGAARDPFVGNAAGLDILRAALANGRYDSKAFDAGVDFFANVNSSVIVLEVPNRMLPKDIQVFASTAMQLEGQWVQVNRLANPLTTHMFFSQDPATSLDHVRHRPDDDGQRRLAMAGGVLRAVTLARSRPDPVAYADSVAERLLPDLLPYEVGSRAAYTAQSINGRRPSDDAMDAALTIFSGRVTTDRANTFDRHPSAFPYVVPIR